MLQEIKRLSETAVAVDLEYSAAEVSESLDEAARKLGRTVALPGFRRGKIPSAVIRKRFARRVAEDACAVLTEEKALALLAEKDLQPLAHPPYSGSLPCEGKPFVVRLEMDVLPEAELPDPEGIVLEIPEGRPGEDRLNDMLDQALGRLARLEDSDAFPQDGDLVTVNVRGVMDGSEVPGIGAQGLRIRLLPARAGAEVPAMDGIVRGLRKGQSGSGTMRCPETYPDPELRGKQVQLEVELVRVQKVILPPADDDTARRLGFEDLEALQKEVMSQTAAAYMQNLRRDLKSELMEKLMAGADIPLPQSLVLRFYREHQQDAERGMKQMGAGEEWIARALEHLHGESLAFARKKAKGHVLLLRFAGLKHIGVSTAEAENAMRGAAQSAGAYEAIRSAALQSGALAVIRERMTADRALEELFRTVRKTHKGAFSLPSYADIKRGGA